VANLRTVILYTFTYLHTCLLMVEAISDFKVDFIAIAIVLSLSNA